MPSITRRALLRPLAGAALASTLVEVPAHAGYNVWTGQFTIAQQDLQAQVETRFPLGFPYPPLFDVRVQRPRLGLNPAGQRVAVTVDVLVRSAFTPQALKGLLTISSRLRFDAPTRSVRLVDPAADRIDFQGLAPADAQQLQAIGQAVAKDALQDWPLHTFRPEDLTMGSRVFKPGEITVQETTISVAID